MSETGRNTVRWIVLGALACLQATAGAVDVWLGHPPPNLLSLCITGTIAGWAIGNLLFPATPK